MRNTPSLPTRTPRFGDAACAHYPCRHPARRQCAGGRRGQRRECSLPPALSDGTSRAAAPLPKARHHAARLHRRSRLTATKGVRTLASLPLLGLATVVLLLAAILSKRVSPLVALVCFPVAASLAAGFGLQTGHFILSGVQSIAPVIGMFVFRHPFFRDHDRCRNAGTAGGVAAARRGQPPVAHRSRQRATWVAGASRWLGEPWCF